MSNFNAANASGAISNFNAAISSFSAAISNFNAAMNGSGLNDVLILQHIQELQLGQDIAHDQGC